MIRQPSTYTEAYRWWRDAVAGLPVAMHPDLPECGFYRMRRVSGGPYVPVSITLKQVVDPDTRELTEPETYVALVEGLPADAAAIWTRLTPICRADYDALVERQRSDDQFAASMVPMDLSATPTLPPRRP